MAPQPSKEDLEFLERKEELIIAKQLRACRVSILPKFSLQQQVGLQPVPPPRPTPAKKHSLQVPTPRKEQQKAQSPIALRYWNQCTSGSTSPANVNDSSPQTSDESDLDLPWLSKENSVSPGPSPSRAKQKLSVPDLGRCSPTTAQPKISVPDIRNHMQEIEKSEERLREEARYQALLKDAPPYQHKKIDVKTLLNSVQKENYVSSRQDSLHSSNTNSNRHFSQQREEFQNNTSQLRKYSNKTEPLPSKTHATLSPPAPARDHDDPSPMTERKTVVYERILSTAGQGIKRDNEKVEAKMNISRFITMGQIKSFDESPSPKSTTNPFTFRQQSMPEAKLSPKSTQNKFNLRQQSMPETRSPPKTSTKDFGAHQQIMPEIKGPENNEHSSLMHSKHSIKVEKISPMTQKQFAKLYSVDIAEDYVNAEKVSRKEDTSYSSTFSSSDSESDPQNPKDIDVNPNSNAAAAKNANITNKSVARDNRHNIQIYDTGNGVVVHNGNTKDIAGDIVTSGEMSISGDVAYDKVIEGRNNVLNNIIESTYQQSEGTEGPDAGEKEKMVIDYLLETDPSQIAASVLHKVDERRKNALGLIFYREMSSDLIKEIIAQEIMNKSGAELSLLLEALPTEVKAGVLTRLAPQVSPQEELRVRLRNLDVQQRRSLLQEFNQDSVDYAEELPLDNIPEIVVSPDNGGVIPEIEDRSLAESFISATSERPDTNTCQGVERPEEMLVDFAQQEVDDEVEWEEWEEEEEEEEEEDSSYTRESFDASFSIKL